MTTEVNKEGGDITESLFPELAQKKITLEENSRSMDRRSEAREKIADAFETILTALGLDIEDDNLSGTPDRYAKMLVEETCSSLFKNINSLKLTDFDNRKGYSGMVKVGPIKIKSLCAHHFAPFFGYAYIAYIPGKKILGLSKLARIADFFARKPNDQETLTQEIYDFLGELLETDNIIVMIDCTHTCMSLRGCEQEHAITDTCLMGGLFKHNPSAKDEFFRYVNLNKGVI